MRLSFGIKTSQMGLSYPDILRVWRDADQVPLFEHAWPWDRMVPLRGDARGRPWRPGPCSARSPRRPSGCASG